MASKETIIHSGQFMSSHVHEVKDNIEEEIVIKHEATIERAIESVADTQDDSPITFYKFGPETTQSIEIDTSLKKLNRCLRIIYDEGVVYTPKWKQFQGLNFAWKDRVRLNNVIWRAWFLHFVRRVHPKYCFFSIPEEDMRKPQLPVVDGMVWKRRNETVATQYHMWRRYYYRRLSTRSKSQAEPSDDGMKNNFNDAEMHRMSFAGTTSHLSNFDDDDLSNWFTDTLFSNLGQPYLFPDPKEMAQAGNADIIQPGLVQLQPSLEEIMRSFDIVNEVPYDGIDFQSTYAKRPESLEILPLSNGRDSSKVYLEQPVILDHQSNCLPVCTNALSIYNPITVSYSSIDQFPLVNQSASAAAYCPPFVALPADSQSVQYSMAKTWNHGDSLAEQQPSCSTYQMSSQAAQLHSQHSVPQNKLVLSQHQAKAAADKVKRRRLQSSKQLKVVQGKSVATGNVGPSLSTSNAGAETQNQAKKLCYVDNMCQQQSTASQPYLPSQGCIVRPIPIALNRSEHSAFNSFSPPAYPTSSMSNGHGSSSVQLPPNQPLCHTMLSQYATASSGIHFSPAKLLQMECPLKPSCSISPGVNKNGLVRNWKSKLDNHPYANKASPATLDRSEQKRIQHLQAEQFRRSALKVNGFDLLEEMLFDGVSTPSKPTNAVVLAKAADEIRSLRKVFRSNETVLNALKAEVDKLNERINIHQNSMESSQSSGQTEVFELMLRIYAKQKLKNNWKLWPLWKLIQPFCESYSSQVNGSACSQVSESAGEWMSKACNPSAIRSALSELLVQLATDSPLLRNPKGFQKWVEKMANDMQ